MGSGNSKKKQQQAAKNQPAPTNNNNTKPQSQPSTTTNQRPKNNNDNTDDKKSTKPAGNTSHDANKDTKNDKDNKIKDKDGDGLPDFEDDGKNLKRLHAACQKENLENVKVLINRYKTSVTEKDKETGKTALHYCASNKDTHVADAVLDNDSSCLNIKDASGFTAFLLASVAGNLKMVKFLKERGTNVKTSDHEGHTAAHWTAVCGHADVLEYLHDNGVELSTCDKNGATPLHYAVHGSDDVSPDQSQKMVKMLLAKKVKVDAMDEDKRTPLLWAASSGRDKTCEILLDAGANIEATDQDGLTSLHSAAAKGYPKCIEVLIRRKAKIEATDKNGCTPLFYAVHQNEMDCAKLLLDNKANTSHCDRKGRSVSHCAAAIGNLEAMKLLKKHKADLWMKSKETGDMPIHEAAMAGHTEIVNFLMDGVDKDDDQKELINTGNNNGKTCLHMAALSNNLPLCKFLVQNGANVNAPMKHGDSVLYPYDCAVMKQNQECAKYLKQNGAKSSKDDEDDDEKHKNDPKKDPKKPAQQPAKKPVEKKEMGVQTIENKNSVVHKINSESQTSRNNMDDKKNNSNNNNNVSNNKHNKNNTTERGVQTIETKKSPEKKSKHDDDDEEGRKDNSPKKSSPKKQDKNKKSPKKTTARSMDDDDKSQLYSSYEEEDEEDSGNGSEDEKRKKNKKNKKDSKNLQAPKRQNEPNRSPARNYNSTTTQPLEPRRLVNLNVHPNIIREQVRAYETKRLAAMKLNHANRMQMNGKGFSEQRLVRKLARDYNDDARPEDRIPSGHFKTMKDFHNFLKGEISIADIDEQRLRKLEKIKPIYYITF